MISNKKFLLLSLLMAPAAKADCAQESNCCPTESTCVKTCDTTSCNTNPECCSKVCPTPCEKPCMTTCDTSCKASCDVACDQTNCETKLTECTTCDKTTCEAMDCQAKNMDCTSCGCSANPTEDDLVRFEGFDCNNDVRVDTTETTEESEEQTTTRLKITAIIEAEKTFEHIFKIFAGASNAYLAMSPAHKTTFAKTIVEFFFNVQKELKAHSALFEKIGPDYIKATENLRFDFVEVAGKSEEENLKDKFSYITSKVAQFYVDFGYVYKNLTAEEQAELAQVFADIYFEQREVCKENAEVLNEIVQIFGKAISAK